MPLSWSGPALRGRHSRRRPKDRRARIARAAAEVFSARGYQLTTMEAIATKVGISAPALYRHYPSKYDLFVAAVLGIGQHLVDCTDFVDTIPEAELAADPGAVLTRVIDALIAVTLASRGAGRIYRWQVRHLKPVERASVVNQRRVINHRIQAPLTVLRPELTTVERWTLSMGMLSVVGSVDEHPVALSQSKMHALLADAASAIATARLPEPIAGAAVYQGFRSDVASDTDAYEAVLRSAMTLFADQGYEQTSMAQIATSTGIPLSGIYRSFPGKAEILAAGLRRAGERLFVELSRSVADLTDPRQVLTRLVESYVATWFDAPEMAVVYFVEGVHLAPPERAALRSAQRSVIDFWTSRLTSVRPELDSKQAQVLVYAAMILTFDIGWLLRYQQPAQDGQLASGSAHQRACVRKLMELTLFGSPADQRM